MEHIVTLNPSIFLQSAQRRIRAMVIGPGSQPQLPNGGGSHEPPHLSIPQV